MQRRIVYLVTSGECGWGDIRRVLQSLPGVSVLETSSVRDAFQGLNGRTPDLLLLSADIARTLPADQWEDCLPPRERPYRFAVIGASPQSADPPHHAHLELAGQVLWPDLSADNLPAVLATLLETPLLLVSPEVARRFVVYPARETPDLTDEERLVVRRLAEGLTDKEIAAREPVSARTVERVVGKLAAMFGVRSRFALGVEVARRGLLERVGG